MAKKLTGNGTTIAFGTTSQYDVIDIEGVTFDGISLPDINVSHLGTTGYEKYIPGPLIEGGTVSVTFQVDTDEYPLPIPAEETVTISPPITHPTNATGPTIAAPCYINNVTWEMMNDEDMLGTYTLKVSGDITFTPSAA